MKEDFSVMAVSRKRMPVLQLQYTAYVEVKVPKVIAGMMKSGLVGYGNKWGDVFLRGLEKSEYCLTGVVRDVDYKRADEEEWVSDDEDEEDEVFAEKCGGCDKWLGETIFTDEEEYDNHPDRVGGYDEDEVWWCVECRKDQKIGSPPPVVVEPLPVPPRKSVRLSGRTGSVKPLTFPFPQMPSKGFTIDKNGMCDCCEPSKHHPEFVKNPDCEICKKECESVFGNNPRPLPFKICCDKCNQNNVIPARMMLHYYNSAKDYKDTDEKERKERIERQTTTVIHTYSQVQDE